MSKRILVIDDERAVRNVFADILEDAGLLVCQAASGEAGLAAFLTEGPFHLIFLDLHMPGMSGVDVLREIRERDSTVPLFLITAYEDEFLGPLAEARRAGADFQLLTKPVGVETLLSVTSSTLGLQTRAPLHAFRLYVAGVSPGVVRVLEELKTDFAKLLAGGFEIELIDVLTRPQEALKANVLATPALAVTHPGPVRTVVGDLSDAGRVLLTLGIRAGDGGAD